MTSILDYCTIASINSVHMLFALSDAISITRGGKMTVTVPGPAAAANAARRIERNLNNIDLNDISRKSISLSLRAMAHDHPDTCTVLNCTLLGCFVHVRMWRAIA